MNIIDNFITKMSTQFILTLKGIQLGKLSKEEEELLKSNSLPEKLSSSTITKKQTTKDAYSKLMRQQYSPTIVGCLEYLRDFHKCVLSWDESDEVKTQAILGEYLESRNTRFHLTHPIFIKDQPLILFPAPSVSDFPQPESFEAIVKDWDEAKSKLTYATEVLERVISPTLIVEFLAFAFRPENIEAMAKEYDITTLKSIRGDWRLICREGAITTDEGVLSDGLYINYRYLMVIKLFDEIIYKLEEAK